MERLVMLDHGGKRLKIHRYTSELVIITLNMSIKRGQNCLAQSIGWGQYPGPNGAPLQAGEVWSRSPDADIGNHDAK